MSDLSNQAMERNVRRAIGDNRIQEAEVRLERAVLLNERIEPELLELLPASSLVRSPLLRKAWCEHLARQGDLLGARDGLSGLLAELAASTLRAPFLSALSLLAVTQIRIGQLQEAAPVVRFLYDEWERAEEETGGDVPYAIAKGAALLEAELPGIRRTDYYAEAIGAYERDGEREKAMLATLALLVGEAGVMPPTLWEGEMAALEQRIRMLQQGSSYLHYARAVRAWRQGDAALAAMELRGCKAESLAYPYQWRALLLDKLASLQLAAGANDPEWEQAAMWLAEHEDKLSVDLELRFGWLAVRFQLALKQSDPGEATRLLAQAGAIARMGLLADEELELSEMELSLKAAAERCAPVAASVKEKAEQVKCTGDIGEADTAGPWRVRLFGGFVLTRAGRRIEQIEWKRSKTKELLLYLLLQPGYEAKRDLAAEELFPECPADKIGNRFYVAVHQLKQVLERYLGAEGGVTVKDGIIRLAEDLVEEVDAEKYMTLYRIGRQLWPAERSIAASMYEQAEPLYDLIAPDMRDSDWLERFRERMLSMQSDMLDKLCAAAQERGELDRAEGYARELIRIQPLEETAYRPLLQLLTKQGRHADAEYEFRKLVLLLSDELGIEPTPELSRLAGRGAAWQ